jgi:hypothetical protein
VFWAATPMAMAMRTTSIAMRIVLNCIWFPRF